MNTSDVQTSNLLNGPTGQKGQEMARNYRRKAKAKSTTPNRFAKDCHFCKASVPAQGGRMWSFKGRYYVAHLDCHSAKEPRVSTFATSGWSGTQNSSGRCEDAPCCGCCTF